MLRRVIALVLLTTFVHACTTWRVRPVEPKYLNSIVRVTTADAVVTFQRPTIAGDSLFGMRQGLRVGIPIANIRRVQVREVDVGKTALAIAGIGITMLIVAAALEPDPPPPPPPPPSSNPCIGSNCGFSCPLVYSWDGTQWRLDSGTFGGAIMRALARTDVDNLTAAVAQNGELRLRVANELAETDYLDALSVLAVDHDPGVTVAPDGNGAVHTIGNAQAPIGARDFAGRDVLARVTAADGWSWESAPSIRDTSRVDQIRDGVELTFARQAATRTARLVIDGHNTPWAARMLGDYVSAHGRETMAWYDSLNANPDLARRVGATLAQEAFLAIAVRTAAGWERQGLVWEAGPEIVKRQVATLDLSRVTGDSVRVRLESAPSFWLLDRVALDYAAPQPFTVRELFAASAIDHSGRDVRSRLQSVDGTTLTMETGDGAELRFQVPEMPAGKARSYLVRSHGWYEIKTVTAGEPRTALLRRIGTEPYAISRITVSRMNDALHALNQAAR